MSLGGGMEDLTLEEVEELHGKLVILNEELRLLIDLSEDETRPVDLDQPIGRLSRMDAIAQQNIDLANRRAAQVRIQRIRVALQRIADGEYGSCLSCGDPIGVRRLAAQPEAPFCILCQSQREAGHSASVGRPTGRG